MPEVRIAACTIAAKSTLALGRVVAESFLRHHPSVPCFLLLADEVDGYFEPDREQYKLITLPELGYGNARELAFRYSQQEFSYALTPTLLLHLLRRGFERVLFIKQESLVTGDLIPEFEELQRSSLLLTPHLLRPLTGTDAPPRELNILLSGMYNGGCVGVANVPETVAFLEWWQDRLRSHCLHDVGLGMHFEQRWLDFAPAFVRNVGVSRDPGLNVGHWNLLERHVKVSCGYITADGRPCRLFRFSGYDRERPDQVTRYSNRLTTANIGSAAEVFGHYARLLDQAGYDQVKNWPYAFDQFDNGVPIPPVVRRMFREMHDAFDHGGDPFHSMFDWLLAASEAPGITRLGEYLYDNRPDVQQAFPDLTGSHREPFLEWLRTFGVREYSLAPQYVA